MRAGVPSGFVSTSSTNLGMGKYLNLRFLKIRPLNLQKGAERSKGTATGAGASCMRLPYKAACGAELTSRAPASYNPPPIHLASALLEVRI